MANQTTRRSFSSSIDPKELENARNKHSMRSKARPRSLEAFEKYLNSKAVLSLETSAKYCFSVKDLSQSDKDSFNSSFESANPSELTTDVNWSVAHFKDFGEAGEDGKTYMDSIVRAYEAVNGKDARFASYGEATLTVDFSKIPLLEDGHMAGENILYPYGVFFFSDDGSPVNAFKASIACYPDLWGKVRHKRPFTVIEDYKNVKITGNFRNRGRFVIFFVSSEEEEDLEDGNVNYKPDVTTVVIDVKADKENNIISNVYADDSREIVDNSEDFSEYIVKHVFFRYTTFRATEVNFMSDYVFMTGGNTKAIDFTFPTEEMKEKLEKKTKKFEEKKTDSDKKDKPSRKPEKKNKKDNKKSKKYQKKDAPKDEQAKPEESKEQELSANEALDAANKIANDEQESNPNSYDETSEQESLQVPNPDADVGKEDGVEVDDYVEDSASETDETSESNS